MTRWDQMWPMWPKVDFLKTWAQVWKKNWSEKISQVKIVANGFHKNLIHGTMKHGETLRFGENCGGTKLSQAKIKFFWFLKLTSFAQTWCETWATFLRNPPQVWPMWPDVTRPNFIKMCLPGRRQLVPSARHADTGVFQERPTLREGYQLNHSWCPSCNAIL